MTNSVFENIKTPCWEYKKCTFKECPMHGKKKTLDCWTQVGTFCKGEIQGRFAQKFNSCTECDYFKSIVNAFVHQETLILSQIMKAGKDFNQELFVSDFPVDFGILLYKQWKEENAKKEE